jgi:hypothetical protein
MAEMLLKSPRGVVGVINRIADSVIIKTFSISIV